MIIPFCAVSAFLCVVVIEPNKSSVPIFALPFTSKVAFAVCELIESLPSEVNSMYFKLGVDVPSLVANTSVPFTVSAAIDPALVETFVYISAEGTYLELLVSQPFQAIPANESPAENCTGVCNELSLTLKVNLLKSAPVPPTAAISTGCDLSVLYICNVGPTESVISPNFKLLFPASNLICMPSKKRIGNPWIERISGQTEILLY